MNSRKNVGVTLTAGFAALYAVIVIFLAPISFQLFQVRVADALLPLAMIFGWPAIVGFSLGALVANFFGGLGIIDILGGAFANLAATFISWKVASNRGRLGALLGIGLEIVTVTLIVGSYLSYLFGIPIQAGWVGVLLGSIVAIGLLGSMLLFALSRNKATAILRSYGLLAQQRQLEG